MITRLRPDHIPGLYQLYKAQTEHIPHCLLPSEGRFRADLDEFAQEGLLVAESSDGHALGFAALTAIKDYTETSGDGITALFFAEQAVGQVLLDACMRLARPGPVLAFPMLHRHGPIQGYNAGWHGLSDRMPHVARLLARSGFGPYYRELHLICDLQRFAHQATSAPEGIAVVADTDEDGFVQRAVAGSQTAGACTYYFLDPRADDPRALQTGYIDPLWVAPEQRRRGLARHLLIESLEHLRRLGRTACWLTTGADNWTAQPLYLSLGFEVVDISACYRRG
jgi:ribosomal protein S18 acetylase RimI-like enzyme